jgi:hypothetical protein
MRISKGPKFNSRSPMETIGITRLACSPASRTALRSGLSPLMSVTAFPLEWFLIEKNQQHLGGQYVFYLLKDHMLKAMR